MQLVPKGKGVMILKGGSMINAQRRAATKTATFIYMFCYNYQFLFHLQHDFLDEFNARKNVYNKHNAMLKRKPSNKCFAIMTNPRFTFLSPEK